MPREIRAKLEHGEIRLLLEHALGNGGVVKMLFTSRRSPVNIIKDLNPETGEFRSERDG
jgi:hypothetical protein